MNATGTSVTFVLTDGQQRQQQQQLTARAAATRAAVMAAAQPQAPQGNWSTSALTPSMTLISAEVHRPLVADPNCDLLDIEASGNLTQATQAFQRATKQLEVATNSRSSMKKDKMVATAAARLAKATAALERAKAAVPVLTGRFEDTPVQVSKHKILSEHSVTHRSLCLL